VTNYHRLTDFLAKPFFQLVPLLSNGLEIGKGKAAVFDSKPVAKGSSGGHYGGDDSPVDGVGGFTLMLGKDSAEFDEREFEMEVRGKSPLYLLMLL